MTIPIKIQQEGNGAKELRKDENLEKGNLDEMIENKIDDLEKDESLERKKRIEELNKNDDDAIVLDVQTQTPPYFNGNKPKIKSVVKCDFNLKSSHSSGTKSKNSNMHIFLDKRAIELTAKYEQYIEQLKEEHKHNSNVYANKNDLIAEHAKSKISAVESRTEKRLDAMEKSFGKLKNLDGLTATLQAAINILDGSNKDVSRSNEVRNENNTLSSDNVNLFNSTMIPAGTCTPSMNDIKQIIADEVKKLDLSRMS